MLFKLWELIQMWLPFWLVIQLNKTNKAVKANIKTRSGKLLKAIMVTPQYGLLFMEKDYLQNRVAVLKRRQDSLNTALAAIAAEMNSLSFEAREAFFNIENEEHEHTNN